MGAGVYHTPAPGSHVPRSFKFADHLPGILRGLPRSERAAPAQSWRINHAKIFFWSIILFGFLPGCGFRLPWPKPPAIVQAKPAAPVVRAILPPVEAASADNVAAAKQTRAIPDRPPAAVTAAKGVVIQTLAKQAVSLAAATQAVSAAVPATVAADSAARTNGAAAAAWQAKYSRLRQREVQMALGWGTAAGGLFVVGGILLAVFTADKIEGIVLGFAGCALIGAVWLAAAHLLAVEIAAAAAPCVFGLWMFVGRHHEHVLRVASGSTAAVAAK